MIDDDPITRLRDFHDQIKPPNTAPGADVFRGERMLRRRRAVAIGAVAAAVVAVLAITAITTGGLGAGKSVEPIRPGPTQGPTPTDIEASGEGPGIGTCWAIPQERLTPDYWFDDSPQVPCTEPHTAETAHVYELDEPTVKEASDLADNCWDAARIYVDVNLDHWVPWVPGLLLPSRQQIADGASFVRCEVLIPANLAGTEFTSLTDSVEGAATERADEMLPCLNKNSELWTQPFAPCDKPHRYEATGQLAELYVDAYPSPEVLQREAVQCRDGLPGRQDTPDHAVTVAWPPPGGIREDGQLAGVCFVYHQDGSLLPTRQ